MKKTIWLAAALFSLSSQAFGYSFTQASQPAFPPTLSSPPESKAIALQATESFSGDTISLAITPPLAVGDRVVLTLTGGTTFADVGYVLEEWMGGAGAGDLSYASLLTAAPNGATSIEFQMSETAAGHARPLAGVEIFILSANSIPNQPTNYNLPQTPGLDISLRAEVFDNLNASKGTTEMVLFESTLPLEAKPIPTLSEYSLVALSLGLAGFARRRMQG